MADAEDRAARLRDYFTGWLASLEGRTCVCAFPRARALLSIDCTDYGGSWFCLETEILISTLLAKFPIASTDPAKPQSWTCGVCGSSYGYHWQDYSIHVSAQTLKPLQLSVSEFGPLPKVPMPLFGGIIGHTEAPREYFVPAEFETFRAYLEERLP